MSATLFELLPRIADKQGELATAVGLGTGYLLERWGIPEQDWQQDQKIAYWKMGHPKHHSSEDAGQCGVIINTQYNRDAQCHSHVNFVRNGLPIKVQKQLAAEIWGSSEMKRGEHMKVPLAFHAPVLRGGPYSSMVFGNIFQLKQGS